MSKHYLVDFENVHERGLSGIGSLVGDDRVYIFHTSGTDRISLSILDGLQAWLTAFAVPCGDQSLDMNLASYLGFLIGRETNPDDRYFIVSYDADYYSVALIWNHCFQLPDKVTCVPAIGDPPGISFRRYNDSPDYLYDEKPEERKLTYEEVALREEILRIFDQQGELTANGIERIRYDILCACLNHHRYFENMRSFYKLRPIGLLENYFDDLLYLKRDKTDIWVYLIPGPYYWNTEEADSVNHEISVPELPEDADHDEIAMLSPDNGFDPDCLSVLADGPGDEVSTSGDETVFLERNSEIAEDEAAYPPETEEATVDQAIALEEYIRVAIRNFMSSKEAEPHQSPLSVRASELRDYLTLNTPFADLQRASGKAPLKYLTEDYADLLHSQRQQGAVWISLKTRHSEIESLSSEDSGVDDPGIADQTTGETGSYAQIHNRIIEQLKSGGMNSSAAETVADCYLLASSGGELKSSLYDSLDRTFGRKVGRFYYRDAIRILGL